TARGFATPARVKPRAVFSFPAFASTSRAVRSIEGNAFFGARRPVAAPSSRRGPTGKPRGPPSMDPSTAAPWPDPEREALRAQAAAAAAQQAALTDEEIRLQQRRAALEQQEQQLAAHLEAKRQRLQDLHDRTRLNREDLLKERAAYERRVGQVTRDLAQSRRE